MTGFRSFRNDYATYLEVILINENDSRRTTTAGMRLALLSGTFTLLGAIIGVVGTVSVAYGRNVTEDYQAFVIAEQNIAISVGEFITSYPRPDDAPDDQVVITALSGEDLERANVFRRGLDPITTSRQFKPEVRLQDAATPAEQEAMDSVVSRYDGELVGLRESLTRLGVREPRVADAAANLLAYYANLGDCLKAVDPGLSVLANACVDSYQGSGPVAEISRIMDERIHRFPF